MKDDLEQLLSGLAPRGPSQQLTEAVRTRLRRTSAPARGRQLLSRCVAPALLLAAAACMALLLAKPFQPPIPEPSPETAASLIEPRRATETIVATAEEMIYTGENSEPVRSVHYRGVRTLEFRNNQTGATWTVSYPWQETAFVPIRSL